MGTRYYPTTINRVRSLVQQKYPEASPSDDLLDKPGYVLWMFERIEEMRGDPTKAARWIGYAVRMAEELELLSNAESRELCRTDVQDGFV